MLQRSLVCPRVNGTLKLPLCCVQCARSRKATLEFALEYLAKRTPELVILGTRSLGARRRVVC